MFTFHLTDTLYQASQRKAGKHAEQTFTSHLVHNIGHFRNDCRQSTKLTIINRKLSKKLNRDKKKSKLLQNYTLPRKKKQQR